MSVIIKMILSVVIAASMQVSMSDATEVSPQQIAGECMEGIKTMQEETLDRYAGNSYINFISNLEGNEETVQRMRDALLQNFDYTIDEVLVDDGGNAELPKDPKKKGYHFKGWIGKYEDVKEDVTITADWEDAVAYWEPEVIEAKDGNSKDCIIVDADDTEWINNAGVKSDENADCVIIITNNYSGFDESEAKETYSGKTIYVISDEAEESKYTQLAYTIKLMNKLHGSGTFKDEDEALTDLLGNDKEVKIKKI